jgi:site-specific DNA recombinase
VLASSIESAVDKELASIKSQRVRFLKLFEGNGDGDDLFFERLGELKVRQEWLLSRRNEVERQPEDSIAESILPPGTSSFFDPKKLAEARLH